MNSKEMKEFVELLYPFVLKKIKEDQSFKNVVKMKNAIVEKDADQTGIVEVKFPYDTTSFTAINKTGESLTKGQTVCIEYWVDLKNAIAKYVI